MPLPANNVVKRTPSSYGTTNSFSYKHQLPEVHRAGDGIRHAILAVIRSTFYLPHFVALRTLRLIDQQTVDQVAHIASPLNRCTSCIFEVGLLPLRNTF